MRFLIDKVPVIIYYPALFVLMLLLSMTASFLLRKMKVITGNDYTVIASTWSAGDGQEYAVALSTGDGEGGGNREDAVLPEKSRARTGDFAELIPVKNIGGLSLSTGTFRDGFVPLELIPFSPTGSGGPAERETASEPEAPGFRTFYIFTDERKQKNHYAPSGWMGDVQDLKFSGARQSDERLGSNCLKISYLAQGPKGWAGIYWQNPANNWGNMEGGYDLRGATAVTFWARGEHGGEKISEFKVGGLTGKYPDSDVAWTGPVKLAREWKQYRIDLRKKDLRYVNGGFCFTVLKSDNPHGCTFYLDEIRYE